ncbi:hypothetical protein H6P81_019423 [Aristolochia fimbriata]|uniref:C3H1-type domain-containing protein n=1 Tax=Aristolochia fimbriata TaxID=158543 RepID=A0AAV7DSM5_ARIFI|nr:hypothetical protein H6P81_019423 [Aristolochia fimbriata]
MPSLGDGDKPASTSGQSEPSNSEGRIVGNGAVADEVVEKKDDAKISDLSQDHQCGGDDGDPLLVSFTPEKLKIDLTSNILPKHDEEVSQAKLGSSMEHVQVMLTSNEVAIDSLAKDDPVAERSNASPSTKVGSLTPLQRPRSMSPTVESEGRAKRSTIICDFYAKGWCIKGSTCKFLHEKHSLHKCSSPSARDLGVAGKGEFMEHIGFGQEFPRSILHSQSPSSKGSNLLATRLLVREYGGTQTQQFEPIPIPRNDPRVLSPVKEVLLRNKVKHDSSMLNYELPVQPWAGEDFHKSHTLRKGCASNYPLNEMEHTRLHPKNYDQPQEFPFIHEEHMYRKHSPPVIVDPERREVLHDRKFGKKYSCDAHNSLPDYRLPSRGSFFAYDSSRGDTTMKPHGQFFSYDEYLSSSPMNSSSRISSSNHSISVFGTSSSHGFSPLITELFDGRGLLDGEKQYYDRRSSSFSRSSSPYHSRSGEDHPMSSGPKARPFSSDWEPSVPFRSSFCPPIGLSSSPEDQYDPILDSLEPANGGTNAYKASTFFNSHGAVIQCLPHQVTNAADVVLDKNISIPRSNVDIVIEATTGDTQNGRPKQDKKVISYELKEHKHEAAKMGFEAKSKVQADRSKHDKESKVLKIFRVALVDFVKELVRPSWRGGQLSKDAHKAIVRKAVDKVLSSLQFHQVPSSDESISQYLSSSRPKLSRLVEMRLVHILPREYEKLCSNEVCMTDEAGFASCEECMKSYVAMKASSPIRWVISAIKRSITESFEMVSLLVGGSHILSSRSKLDENSSLVIIRIPQEF